MVVVRPNYPTIGRWGVYGAFIGFFHFYWNDLAMAIVNSNNSLERQIER